MRRILLPLVVMVALAGCVTARPESARPANWAQPVAQAQLPNLQRVDEGLWRSALPRHPDPATLRTLGIHTVINLRPQADPPWFAGAGIVTRQVGIDTWDIDEAQIAQVLRIAIDPAQRPVLIHCTHGADRTGLMIAAYRMVVQGWSEAEAEREMIRGGYGYHPIWINLPRVLKQLDVARMRRELGVPPLH
ncbi:MAG: tyrosine-protein phosphatase [Thermomonas sp.]